MRSRSALGVVWAAAMGFAVLLRAALRHADLLAGGETQVGVGTLGIDAHLARAQKLLQIAVADVGKPQPEPAIEAQTRLLGCDLDGLDRRGAGHVRANLVNASPAYSARMANSTDAAT